MPCAGCNEQRRLRRADRPAADLRGRRWLTRSACRCEYRLNTVMRAWCGVGFKRSGLTRAGGVCCRTLPLLVLDEVRGTPGLAGQVDGPTWRVVLRQTLVLYDARPVRDGSLSPGDVLEFRGDSLGWETGRHLAMQTVSPGTVLHAPGEGHVSRFESMASMPASLKHVWRVDLRRKGGA